MGTSGVRGDTCVVSARCGTIAASGLCLNAHRMPVE